MRELDGEERPKPTPYPRPKNEDAPSQPAEPDPESEPEVEAEAEAEAETETDESSRRRRPFRPAGKVALALLSVVALASSGYAYVATEQVQNNLPTTNALSKPDDPAAPPADDGATDILLVGSDARTDQQGHQLPLRILKQLRTEDNPGVSTDTIILLRIPKNGGKPSVVSIPRDTWLEVPGRGKTKINSAYGVAKGKSASAMRGAGEKDREKIERDSDQEGRHVLVQTVQDFTQVRVDHYAEVNLLGFYLLTEALGGVKVCLNHSTSDADSGASFRRGEQTVSGGEALSFVRQRKNLPRGDLDRIVRQQAFLSSAINKVMSAGTLASPSTMGNLIEAIHKSIVLDEGLDLLDFAQQVKSIASGTIAFETIPVLNANGRSEDGQQSIVEVDPAAVRQFLTGLVGRTAPTGGGGAPAAAAPTVPCVN